MTNLGDEIKGAATTLEAIASAPLPSLFDCKLCEKSPSSKQLNYDDIITLRKEIKSVLQKHNDMVQSEWALDMCHTLDNDISDIRSLQPDATKLVNDNDGDKCSLYWYVRSKKEANPGWNFSQDSIYNDLADRVSFGFSLQSLHVHEEENIDVQASWLIDRLTRIVKVPTTLKRHKTKESRNNAACKIQMAFRSRRDRDKRNKTKKKKEVL